MGAVQAFPFAWQGAKPIKNRDLMIQFSKCNGLSSHASRLFHRREPLIAERSGRQAALAAASGPHYATQLLRRKFVNGFGMIRRSGPPDRRRKFWMVGPIRK